MSERLTEKSSGCFKYDLKDFKHKVGEFNDYDAFFAYNMAIKRLGELEEEHDSLITERDAALEEVERFVGLYNTSEIDVNMVMKENKRIRAERDAYIDRIGKLEETLRFATERAEKAEVEAIHQKNQAESNQQAYNDMHDAQFNMVKVNRELQKKAEKAEAENERLKKESR